MVGPLGEAATAHCSNDHCPLSPPPQALEALNKKDLGEIKAYTNPPELVETVMQAVMILRQSEPSWAEAKKQLGDTNFIKQLVDFDKDNMSDKVGISIAAMWPAVV